MFDPIANRSHCSAACDPADSAANMTPRGDQIPDDGQENDLIVCGSGQE